MSIEASQAGVPVIASDAPGLVETLPHQWPLLVHGNTVNGYTQLLRQIIAGAFNHNQLAAQAMKFAGEHFNIEQMGTKYLQIYHQLSEHNQYQPTL